MLLNQSFIILIFIKNINKIYNIRIFISSDKCMKSPVRPRYQPGMVE